LGTLFSWFGLEDARTTQDSIIMSKSHLRFDEDLEISESDLDQIQDEPKPAPPPLSHVVVQSEPSEPVEPPVEVEQVNGDDDAPEAVSFATTKQSAKDRTREEQELVSRAAQTRKAANRARDTRLKAAAAASSAERPRLTEEEVQAPVDQPESVNTVQHLPPSLFALASSAIKKAKSEAELIKSESTEPKPLKKPAKRKLNEVSEGQSRDFGSFTVQHIQKPGEVPSHHPAVIVPSKGASTFLNNRLFKRVRPLAKGPKAQGKPEEKTRKPAHLVTRSKSIRPAVGFVRSLRR